MWVQLRETLNTGRYDGRLWPPIYTDFEVPEWEGDRMIASGLAIKVAGPAQAPPVPPSRPLAPEPVATIPEMVSQPSATGQPEIVPEPEIELSDRRPRVTASRAGWTMPSVRAPAPVRRRR